MFLEFWTLEGIQKKIYKKGNFLLKKNLNSENIPGY